MSGVDYLYNNGDHDNDKEDKEEGWRLLLGGLRTEDLSGVVSWDDDENIDDNKEQVQCTELKIMKPKNVIPPSKRIDNLTSTSTMKGCYDTVQEDECIYNLAYKCTGTGYCTPNGKMERPPVKVMKHIDSSSSSVLVRLRGKCLIATQKINANDIIYTERAIVSTQTTTISSLKTSIKTTTVILACQFCFRSLESITKIIGCCSNDNKNNNNNEQRVIHDVPRKDLWPIPELKFDNDNNNNSNNNEQKNYLIHDPFGRIKCTNCNTIFCSIHCQKSFTNQYGSCCTMVNVFQNIPKQLQSNDNDDDDDEHDDSDVVDTEIQSAIALAVRMFVTILNDYRKTGSLYNSNTCSCSLSGLCGEAADITPLELGKAIRIKDDNSDNNNCNIQYTVEPVYTLLTELYDILPEEKNILSLTLFETLTSQAARNGIGMQTQCPFQSYYSALLRTCTRGTEKHEQIQKAIALAVSSSQSSEQQLQRGMDQIIAKNVVPEIATIFPLTSRINHSCIPNAQIQSQQFIDHHIDIVALRDINVGEEITISYINNNYNDNKMKTTTERRKRELYAKYLFECNCPLCCCNIDNGDPCNSSQNVESCMINEHEKEEKDERGEIVLDETASDDIWNNHDATGYTPLLDLDGGSAACTMFSDGTTSKTIYTSHPGSFFADMTAFGYDDDNDDDDSDNNNNQNQYSGNPNENNNDNAAVNNDTNNKEEEEEFDFRSIANNALMALDDDYQRTISMQQSQVIYSNELIAHDNNPSREECNDKEASDNSAFIDSINATEFVADFESAFDKISNEDNMVYTEKKVIPDVNTDAVRKAVRAIRKKDYKLQEKYEEWQETMKKEPIPSVAPRVHPIIPTRVLAAFRKRTENAYKASSNLSRSACIAEALHKLEILKNIHDDDTIRIHIVGCDHVECSSESQLRIYFEPIVRWIGALDVGKPPKHLYLDIIGPNIPSNVNNTVLNMLSSTQGKNRLETAILTCYMETYQDFLMNKMTNNNNTPDIAIAFNAGIWGYNEWKTTIEYLCNTTNNSSSSSNDKRRQHYPFVFTAYTIQECEDDFDVINEIVNSATTTTTGGGHDNKNNDYKGRNMSRACDCVWEPSVNVFASRIHRETANAISGRIYKENNAWQCWRL